VKGRAIYELVVSGEPWTTAEQDEALTRVPRWFERFNTNLR
jgi:hypothetical protein